jgi:hypothetical protein
MHFNLSLSWFLVLAAFVLECWVAWHTRELERLKAIALAAFFLSILVTGFITMSTTGH